MFEPIVVLQDNSPTKWCDNIGISKNNPFVVKLKENKIKIGDDFNNISILPHFGQYIEIGDKLNIPIPPNFNPIKLCVAPFTPNSFIQLISSNKARVFSIENISNTASYEIAYQTSALAIYKVKYDNDAAITKSNLIDALNDILLLDNDGSFISDVSGTLINLLGSIKISALKRFAYQSESIAGITPPQNPAPNHFGYRTYWNAKTNSANWFNFDLYGQCNPAGAISSGSGSFYRNFFDAFVGYENSCASINLTFTNNQNFNIKFPFRLKSAVGFWFPIVDVIIPANTTNYVYTYNFTIPSNNLMGVQFETYNITSESGGNELQSISEWFSLNNIDIQISPMIISINAVTCGFNDTIIPANCTDEVSIDISSYSNEVQFTIETNLGTFTTITYKLIEDNICETYIKLRCSNICNVNVYELYLLGTKIKSNLDVISQESFINSQWQKKSIYRHTIAVYEFRFQPYSSNVIEMLEGLLQYDVIALDNELYYSGDNVLQIDELDYFVYSGRIDMYKQGTEQIKTNCC